MSEVYEFSYIQLELLNRIALHLAESEKRNVALSQVLDWLNDYCSMERGVITLADKIGESVQANIFTSTIKPDFAEKMSYRLGEGITGSVFSTGESVYVENLEDEDYLDRSGMRKHLDLAKTSFFCIAIKYKDDVIGTLSVDKKKATVEDMKKDFEFLQEVARLIAPFVQYSRLQESFDVFVSAKRTGGAFDRLIGKSAAMDEVKKLAAKVADMPTTVLINGETGTGKGVIAEVIHQMSPRKDYPFIEVNCGAIPENLIESELFGHEKGAFTGAVSHRLGVFERAGNGTVFLDEIGELPLALQTRLLRVLQTKQFERVGGSKTLSLNARIITATNRDLEEYIEQGQFRQDLYFRISVFPIQMPPLRRRGKADVMLLIDYFAQKFSKSMGIEIHRFDTPAIDMLTAYHWPGNVRELENVIERAVLLSENGVIHGHHLPPSLQMKRYSEKEGNLGNFEAQVRALEIELITEALKDCNGKQSKAAEQLGLTQRIMQYKVKKYGIDYRQFR